jgi:hypothetical protein
VGASVSWLYAQGIVSRFTKYLSAIKIENNINIIKSEKMCVAENKLGFINNGSVLQLQNISHDS